MDNLKTFFFPDPEYTLVASLCYLLIFLTAYKRYNTLIINHGSYDAPETARPWTTWLRYHGSAVIYACMYPKVLTALHRDLKNDLKDILENIYLFVACAIHSEGITAKKRNKLLRSLGFEISGTERSKGNDVDPNDMAILAVFLIFVIPLSAIFAAFAGNQNMVMIESLTYVVWSAMALYVGIICVAIPIWVKKFKDFSENSFWAAIRPQKGHSWCAYFISGFSAGATGMVVIFLLHFLAPDKPAQPGIIRTIP